MKKLPLQDDLAREQECAALITDTMLYGFILVMDLLLGNRQLLTDAFFWWGGCFAFFVFRNWDWETHAQ